MSPVTRRVVAGLGIVGGVATGVVAAVAGLFVVLAAVRFDPGEAKGMDETLRSFAATPAGPVLLIAAAVGLLLFGLYSFCEARSRSVAAWTRSVARRTAVSTASRWASAGRSPELMARVSWLRLLPFRIRLRTTITTRR